MIQDLFEDGRASMDWYEQTRQCVEDLVGSEDAKLVVQLLAVTSANTTVRANVTLALKAWNQIRRGQPLDGYMPGVQENIIRVMCGRRPTGPKISAFMDALLGEEDAVVVDRWMLRAYGYPHMTPKRLRDIVEDVTQRAEKAGVTPRQYQAAVWFGCKQRDETVNRDNRPFEEILGEMLQNV